MFLCNEVFTDQGTYNSIDAYKGNTKAMAKTMAIRATVTVARLGIAGAVIPVILKYLFGDDDLEEYLNCQITKGAIIYVFLFHLHQDS